LGRQVFATIASVVDVLDLGELEVVEAVVEVDDEVDVLDPEGEVFPEDEQPARTRATASTTPAGTTDRAHRKGRPVPEAGVVSGELVMIQNPPA
jgi:hypothetical protein